MINDTGWSHFARHYFGNLGWFLFLRLLRCFSSPRSLHMTYVFSHGWPIWVGFPHSDICGSKLICQLPAAFRRLPRPSSPVIAKASTTCTCLLDPITSPSYSAITFSFCAVCIELFKLIQLLKKYFELLPVYSLHSSLDVMNILLLFQIVKERYNYILLILL